jgi:hypothetical protein
MKNTIDSKILSGQLLTSNIECYLAGAARLIFMGISKGETGPPDQEQLAAAPRAPAPAVEQTVAGTYNRRRALRRVYPVGRPRALDTGCPHALPARRVKRETGANPVLPPQR